MRCTGRVRRMPSGGPPSPPASVSASEQVSASPSVRRSGSRTRRPSESNSRSGSEIPTPTDSALLSIPSRATGYLPAWDLKRASCYCLRLHRIRRTWLEERRSKESGVIAYPGETLTLQRITGPMLSHRLRAIVQSSIRRGTQSGCFIQRTMRHCSLSRSNPERLVAR